MVEFYDFFFLMFTDSSDNDVGLSAVYDEQLEDDSSDYNGQEDDDEEEGVDEETDEEENETRGKKRKIDE